MRDTSWRTQLRAALYRGDGAAVVALARTMPAHPGEGPDTDTAHGVGRRVRDAGQLLGDGLTIALAQHIAGAPTLATECVGALRERGWAGDTELAAHLDAVLGTGSIPLLRPLPVLLEKLADLLEGSPTHCGGLISLRTGAVWPGTLPGPTRGDGPGEETDRPDRDDPQRWLRVPGHGSGAGYHDRELFIVTLPDTTDLDLVERLRDALDGRDPFRRFTDVLAHRPELLPHWFAFSEERHRGRARAWLAAAGYRPSPRCPDQTR